MKKHISGQLYATGGRTHFTPHDPDLKNKFNQFKVLAMPIERIDHGQHCIATVTENLVSPDPAVHILDKNQYLDPKTGQEITKILAKKHGFTPKHNKVTAKEARNAKHKQINFPKKYIKRTDLRHLNFNAIDPEGCRDRDDALFVEKISGGWHSITAISDVAYYVQYNTALDRAAYERGTTLYLPHGEPYHMLPRAVVDQLSLNQGVDRAVLYCEKFYNDNGETLSSKFNWGAINVKHAMTYQDYHSLVNQNDKSVRDLHEFFQLQKHKRAYNQEIIKDIEGINAFSGQSNSPVEHLMIDTNIEAAHATLSTQTASLYRNNGPTVDMREYNKLKRKMNKIGINLPPNPRHCGMDELNNAIKVAKQHNLEVRATHLLERHMLDRASYSPNNVGHFALNIPYYSHFTSPIRRYPDIIAHRAIHSIIGTKYGLHNDEIENIEQIGEHLSRRNRATKSFEKDLNKYHAIKDLKRLEGNTLRANLLYVNPKSAEVILPLKYGLHISLNQETLEKLNCKIDQKNNQLIFKDDTGRIKYRASRDKKLRATIANVDPSKGTWEISALSPT